MELDASCGRQKGLMSGVPAGPLYGYDGVPFEDDRRMPEVLLTDEAVGRSTSGKQGNVSVPGARPDDTIQLDASSASPIVVRPLMTPVPFVCWVHQFLRQLLASRTRFSYFVMQTISASRDGRDDSIATALFPIPLPFVGIFGDGPDLSSKKKRHSHAMRKLLHLTVMTLNYEHFRQPMSILRLIRRRPDARHRAVYARTLTFFEACGPPAFISLAGCGRKRFQLDARMRELKESLDALGLSSASLYHRGAAGVVVPEDNSLCDEFRPYRALDASRIKLTGRGNWDCSNFLSDLLYMPFVEPEVIRFDIVPPRGAFPEVKEEDAGQVYDLCRVWDANDLLRLVPARLGPGKEERHLHTKVFGNFKNPAADRQIGDRRGRNYVEGQIEGGPAHEIPNTILQLETKRFEEVLVGAIADRRDFYHQFSTTYERSSTNTVFPPSSLGDFQGTSAYEVFQRDFSTRRRDREEIGDFLGAPTPLLVPTEDSNMVFASFGALFQGDHIGVEVACCAHERMLEESGCHPSSNRLCASQPILRNKPVTGLVIDDFFALSAEEIAYAHGDTCDGPSASRAFLERAREAYKREGILGSDDKEIADSLHYKVIGAEVNSSEKMVKKGLVSLGAPAEKRFGLMMLSPLHFGLLALVHAGNLGFLPCSIGGR